MVDSVVTDSNPDVERIEIVGTAHVSEKSVAEVKMRSESIDPISWRWSSARGVIWL